MKTSKSSNFHFSKTQLQLRYLVLFLSLIPFVGAYLYNQGYQIPFVCPIRYFTGIPCLTCGMTRSVMAAVKGKWLVAVEYHLFGPILIVLLSYIIIHVVIELFAKRAIPVFSYISFHKRRFLTILLFMLVGYHLTRLITIYQQGVLIADFFKSPLGQFLLSK